MSDERLPLARATLVALYAMAGMAADLANAAPVWLPDFRPVPIDETLARLAALKPGITCASLSIGRDIAIAAFDSRVISDFASDMLELKRQSLVEGAPQYAPDDYAVIVRAKAGGDDAALTWQQYEQWCREFELVAPSMLLMADPASLREGRPTLIVELSAPSAEGWITGTYL
ncbi:MAG TPA: hypothetical protein VGM50_20090 [Gemmatimonadaceae bacterium]|jgi:hypothetical protein